ncbi:MAG: hypothetical protein QOF53_25 [Nocardioidaceae bacterium]|jgi:hypothetical protein|nr:hypothetical protein [Nocardioidaceae bacterium]
MTDENQRESVPESTYFGRLGRAGPVSGKRSPEVTGGMSGVGVLSCLFGVVALVLAAVDAFPFLVVVVALIGVVSGLRVFLPRVTTQDKVLIGIGVLASLVALVIWLVRLAG